jgi:DNA-binding transcriptional regulator YdaS (Cro superfamily)
MKTFLAEQISTYGNNRLAADLGVSPQAVSKWAKRGEIPPRRVCATARLLGVAAEQLAPELFGIVTKPLTDEAPA